MSVKKGWFWIVLAVLAVVAALRFVYGRVCSDGDESAASGEICSVRAVPSDASALLVLRTLSSISPFLTDSASVIPPVFNSGKGTLSEIIAELLYSTEADSDATLSFHSTMSGRVSQLFSLTSPQSSRQALQMVLRPLTGDFVPSEYNGETIYTAPCGSLCYAFVGGRLLVSDNQVLLESSMRHCQEGLSILDKDEFSQVFDPQSMGAVTLLVRNSDAEKLFSAFAARPYRKYSFALATLSSWSVIDLKADSNRIDGKARLVTLDVNRKYSEVLARQIPSRSRAAEALPFYTCFYYSVNLSEISDFAEPFANFLYANNRRKPSFGSTQGPVEVACAAFMSGDLQWVDLVRAEGSERFSADRVREFCSGYGELFSSVEVEDTCRVGQWTIAGSRSAVEEFRSGKATFLSLDEYLRRSGAEGALSASDSKAVNTVFFNFAQYGDTPLKALMDPWQKRFASVYSQYNFNVLTLRLSSDGIPSATLSLDVHSAPEVLMDIERDTTVTIPAGPFPVKDVSSGETYWFEQTPNLWLRLSDQNRKGLWSAPFTTPICGFVRQVDYYANGKLQMLFASGDKIYLLDRTGHYLGNPRSLGKEVLLGPELFDFEGDGRHSVMVIHTDNTLGLYTLDGKPYPGWNSPHPKERIKTMPSLETIGGERWWVLRTSVQTRILHFDGTPAAVFEEGRRLRPDTQITLIEGTAVKVDCYDGTTCILDLQTGTFTPMKRR